MAPRWLARGRAVAATVAIGGIAWVAASCGGKAIIDPATDAGGAAPPSGGSGGGTSTGAGAAGAGGGTGGAGGVFSCPELPPDSAYQFDCSEPVDCTETSCGTLNSLFDEHGCLRASCSSDASCPGSDKCYSGGCTPSEVFCSDSESGCMCGGTADCGGSYCVPAAIYPD